MAPLWHGVNWQNLSNFHRGQHQPEEFIWPSQGIAPPRGICLNTLGWHQQVESMPSRQQHYYSLQEYWRKSWVIVVTCQLIPIKSHQYNWCEYLMRTNYKKKCNLSQRVLKRTSNLHNTSDEKRVVFKHVIHAIRGFIDVAVSFIGCIFSQPRCSLINFYIRNNQLIKTIYP